MKIQLALTFIFAAIHFSSATAQDARWINPKLNTAKECQVYDAR